MTGTSIDGIDVALVRLNGSGLQIQPTLVRHAQYPIGDLARPLRDAAEQKAITAADFARLAWEFGLLHAHVIETLLDANQPIDLICVHGQTIFHQPPISCQLINPAPIAHRFKCPVVSDLRQADLTAGGQGAPITPIADWIIFRHPQNSRAIINLGGFCNLTFLPPGNAQNPLEQIQGHDLCPCNQVLDAVARTALGQPIDINGAAALAGIADPQAVNTLIAWFNRKRQSNRSLGTGDEAAEWVHHHLSRLSAQDLAASAANAIGGYIATAVTQLRADEIILAGGGARNRALIQSIASIAKAPVKLSDELGVPIHAREAIAMAILGALCADGVPITLPQVTGCASPPPIAGVWSGPIANRGLPPRG